MNEMSFANQERAAQADRSPATNEQVVDELSGLGNKFPKPRYRIASRNFQTTNLLLNQDEESKDGDSTRFKLIQIGESSHQEIEMLVTVETNVDGMVALAGLPEPLLPFLESYSDEEI